MVSCISSDRRPRDREDADPPDTSGDTSGTDTASDTDSKPDADTSSGECDGQHLCEQPEDPCDQAVCDSGRCKVQPRGGEAPCDDGNACTGDGVCQGGECQLGDAIENGSDCDDDTLYCNGVGHCVGGQCAIDLVGECPALGGECVKKWECKEELQGACGPVPVDDDEKCEWGDGVEGRCSAGTCVPPDMIYIPEGVFLMGCDPGALCQSDAKPKHDIELSGYAIDRLEATEGDWRECVGRGHCDPRNDEDSPDISNLDETLPVTLIDWPRARDFCEDQGKRLCTEAQWEKAARGTAGDLYYPWGNTTANCQRANFYELQSGKGCGTGGPATVGEREAGASPYGVLDMAGNVAEWVGDGYNPTIYTTQEQDTPLDPFVDIDPQDAQVRVVRGGGWGDGADALRVFKREAQSAIVFDDEVGVRCCWVPSEVTGSGN